MNSEEGHSVEGVYSNMQNLGQWCTEGSSERQEIRVRSGATEVDRMPWNCSKMMTFVSRRKTSVVGRSCVAESAS
jgi:hypothetical protein